MRIEVWQSPPRVGDQRWHWHLRANNGRIVTDAESFPTKWHALRAAKTMVRSIVARLDAHLKITFESKQSGDKLIVKWF